MGKKNKVIRKNDTETIFLEDLLKLTALFVVISPILVYLLVFLINRHLPVELLSKFQVSNSDTWIGFSGSILGGSMTMFALIFSIQHEREKSQKDRALALMPVIEISNITKINSDQPTFWTYSNGTYAKLKISNVSDNHARSIKIRLVKFTISELLGKDTHLILTKNPITWPEIDLLPGKSNKEFRVEIVSLELEKLNKELSKSSFFLFDLLLEIEVCDILAIQCHLFETSISGTISLNDERNWSIPVLDDEDNVVDEIFNKFSVDLYKPNTKLK